MKQLNRILECSLYAGDLKKIEDFYTNIFGLKVISRQANRHVFFKVGDMVLLYFNPAETSIHLSEVGGSIIPLHGAMGLGHIAFSVEEEELGNWREVLLKNDIEIESEVNWKKGGKSIYFRDPSGNSIELATPKLWDL